MFMFIFIRRFALAVLISLAWSAPGAAQDTETNWSCWLHTDGVQAVCMVLAPDHEARLAPDHEARLAPVMPRIDRALGLSPTEFVRVVRERPSELRGRQVYVPLHTEPDDEAAVAVLVKAVLCGARPRCEARYQHDMSRLFAHAPELFVDLNDLLWEGQNI